MNAFENAQSVERRSLEILDPYLGAISKDRRYVRTLKGRLALEVQRTYGDIVAQGKDDSFFTIELKAEETNAHGNFYLEEWSNRSRFTRGWMNNLDVCFLLYHFIADDQLFVVDFQKLKKWAYCCSNGGRPRLYSFPMRVQGKRDQLNDTWGACVPISVIRDEVGLVERAPSQFSVPSPEPSTATTPEPTAAQDEWLAAYDSVEPPEQQAQHV